VTQNTDDNANPPRFTRANMISIAAAVGTSFGLSPAAAIAATAPSISAQAHGKIDAEKGVSFYGKHQAGILTPQQRHTYFAVLDVTATSRADVIAMLKYWTAAADRLTQGLLVDPMTDAYNSAAVLNDSGETVGTTPQNLTITVGFGPSFFSKNGVDRFQIAHKRPAALVDLPKFPGDQMIEGKTGGDISLQACADDPQVAFHAVRQLVRIAGKAAALRWVESGYLPSSAPGDTPRNIMGFKDGTINSSDADKDIWVGEEGPAWMENGSYMIVRRIRIALEHWDRMNLAFQEQVVGRSKATGAPIGAKHEFDAVPLKATDKDGNSVVDENSHVRLAHPDENNGAQLLRRGYTYNDGVSFVAERWPPWRQAMEYDAGLLFMSYQRDPRTSFIPMFEKMSRMDMLNQFTTHNGGGIFACCGGIDSGKVFAQKLFT
jgi:deferrochelatase/peroxidase EfeB